MRVLGQVMSLSSLSVLCRLALPYPEKAIRLGLTDSVCGGGVRR